MVEQLRRVLVVEDEAALHTILKIGLKSSYALDSAYDGEQAVERIDRGEQYDVALIDLKLPKGDGYKVLKRLQEADKACGRKTRAVAFTAQCSKADEIKIKEAGFDDYIQKPFQIRDIKTRIDGLLVSGV